MGIEQRSSVSGVGHELHNVLCRGIEAEHPGLCSNIIFICGMSARGRTEFYQPIVEHLCSIPDCTDPSKKLLTCVTLCHNLML